MRLSDLPTPCLVLDRQVLQRNLARMASAVEAGGVTGGLTVRVATLLVTPPALLLTNTV